MDDTKQMAFLAAALGVVLALSAAPAAMAQSFRVQCPSTTPEHPTVQTQDGSGNLVPDAAHPGFIKCQHISGGDGYATMADGHQIYLFGFGPLSGLQDIASGLPGTESALTFNAAYNPNGGLTWNDPNGGIVGTNGAPDTTYVAPAPNNAAIIDPQQMMNVGVMNANAPAPAMAIDEDDEFFLTLSNVGMIMRPDLFEQHTVHFHGYPNASSFFDGVPDASVAIAIAGSFTYYYQAPDAGTYFWHCHITPPEHLQMGMVGQLWVRPRQNRVPLNASLYAAALANRCVAGDILCAAPVPASANNALHTNDTSGQLAKYAYNDGDGSTRYDVEYPIQIMGFDPNFHFVGMTFNPEQFKDMKDKYYLLSGRSYPDTVYPNLANNAGVSAPQPLATEASDGFSRPSQPVSTLIRINKSQGQTRALLRLSNLSVTEYSTLATLGVPMTVIGFHARLLRDEAGHNLYYQTNSITMGGGESADVILDVSDPAYAPGQTFFLYSTNLDHLSNDAENFGGMMTEIQIL